MPYVVVGKSVKKCHKFPKQVIVCFCIAGNGKLEQENNDEVRSSSGKRPRQVLRLARA